MKKLLTVLLSFLLLFTFVSCDTEDTEAPSTLDYDSTKIQENMNSLIQDKGLYIEMEVSGRDENGETTQSTIAYGETATAFYFCSDDEEMLVDFSNEAYALSYNRYGKDEKWEMEKITYASIGLTRETYRQNYSTYSAILFSYFGSYSVYSGLEMAKSSDKVAGRDCDKFVYKATVLGAESTYTFSVDKETGMCLKWEASADALGVGSASADFTCTKFEPSYTPAVPDAEEILNNTQNGY